MTYKKKLIEVSLPLEAINRESAREKSIRHGHPSTLHLWWARRPLAACRAVLFASLVDDPSADPGQFPTEEAQQVERERLFRIIEELVRWEGTTNETVLGAARAEIMRSCGGKPPPVVDPFCGGGSIPIEAQRLGLEVHASDLNPVAVIITKGLIEIPSRFAGRPPVHPDTESRLKATQDWVGAHGLAEDVRYYGKRLRDEAERRIGNFYPTAQLPPELGGTEAQVIAWVWARIVKSPNPAWDGPMPLVRSFALSTKKGKETWVQPIVDRENRRIRFEIRTGEGCPEGSVGRKGAICLATGTPVPLSYIKQEGMAGRMSQQLMAIVAEGHRTRVYLAPNNEHVSAAASATAPLDAPDFDLATHPQYMGTPRYGLARYRDLFTDRQMLALVTLYDLISEVRAQVRSDAELVSHRAEGAALGLDAGGDGPLAYADAIATYLCLALSKAVDAGSAVCSWHSHPSKETLRNTFARQAIPMAWDFAEANFFASSTGSVSEAFVWVSRVIDRAGSMAGRVQQLDARAVVPSTPVLWCTDPPYYDNVPYADLSDYFYPWMRRSLREVFPDVLSTLLVPKNQELVADQERFGSRDAARAEFEGGLAQVFANMRATQVADVPLSVFYAFKQTESDGDVGTVSSTGWETILEGLLREGLVVSGTWPMRSELGNRMRSLGSNALASSIVLVCRPRAKEAALATRKELLGALKAELPGALRHLQQGNIAPVDLAQAAIGPGMGVFSRYSKVVEADGQPMTVRTALGLINQVLDETLAEQESDFDPDTRWALAWFEQYGTDPGPFGVAETLSRAKNTAVNTLVLAGFLESRGGKVRLLDRDELSSTWDPATDKRLTVWEVTQHLMRVLESRGEAGAAEMLRRVGGLGETARELAYRLYVLCERKKWAKEALGYNGLVVAWPEISRLAAGEPVPGLIQERLL